MSTIMSKEQIRSQIADLVKQYADLAYMPTAFDAGKSVVPPSGKVIGAKELQNMVEASLDGWLTTGRFNDAFEKRLTEFLGVKHALTTNSGSSANLLAFSALTSHKLGERAIQPGDEVISVAAGFPTTVNPILQFGAVPVFVDVHIPTYNIDPTKIEAAIGPKTKAIMLAHTLGNPYNLDVVVALARKHKLWLIEDCCDALGSIYTHSPTGGGAEGEGASVGKSPWVKVVRYSPIMTSLKPSSSHSAIGAGIATVAPAKTIPAVNDSAKNWGIYQRDTTTNIRIPI